VVAVGGCSSGVRKFEHPRDSRSGAFSARRACAVLGTNLKLAIFALSFKTGNKEVRT